MTELSAARAFLLREICRQGLPARSTFRFIAPGVQGREEVEEAWLERKEETDEPLKLKAATQQMRVLPG